MNGHCRWCAWCCKLRYPLCCRCKLCRDCCRCPPPCYPYLCPLAPLPPLPCLPPGPPPTRVIREHVIVPVPYPYPFMCVPYCPCPPPPRSTNKDKPCYSCNPFASCNKTEVKQDPCCYNPCEEPGEDFPPRPRWPCQNRIHECDKPLVPGYRGHIPGFKRHSAGRTFGQATRDTCCIMSHWNEVSPNLPCRIFEQ